MKKHNSSQDRASFIFNIEVLVEGKNNAAALEQLLHSLNGSDFVDFRILSGIQLGEQIEHRKNNTSSTREIPLPPNLTKDADNVQPNRTSTTTPEKTKEAKKADKPAADALEALSYYDKIRALMKNNTLIRLLVNKGLGITLSIPCRIINMDESENIITVYHVDEKQVYTFRMNEIEDFSY